MGVIRESLTHRSWRAPLGAGWINSKYKRGKILLKKKMMTSSRLILVSECISNKEGPLAWCFCCKDPGSKSYCWYRQQYYLGHRVKINRALQPAWSTRHRTVPYFPFISQSGELAFHSAPEAQYRHPDSHTTGRQQGPVMWCFKARPQRPTKRGLDAEKTKQMGLSLRDKGQGQASSEISSWVKKEPRGTWTKWKQFSSITNC